MRLDAVLYRALALKCPVCGKGEFARGWLSTNERCSSCGTDFVVEPGYYLGAIYFNYGVTAVIAASAAVLLMFAANLPPFPVVASLAVFCVLFPLWFFRYARSLWLSFDHYYDRRKKKAASKSAAVAEELNHAGDEQSEEPVSAVECICQRCHHKFSVPARHARKWSKCPACSRDVFLAPLASS